MEEILDLILVNYFDCDLPRLLACVNKYLNGRNHNIELLEKKLLIDYEIFINSNFQNSEYKSFTCEHKSAFDVLRTNKKKRIVDKYKEISLKAITKLFSIKDNGEIKLILSNINSLYLLLKLLICLISDGVKLLTPFEEDFTDYIKQINYFICSLTKNKEVSEIEADNELISDYKCTKELNPIISKLIALTTSIFLSYQKSTEQMLKLVMGFYQSTKLMAGKQDKSVQRELLKDLFESSVEIYSKSAIEHDIENLNLNINFVLSLFEELVIDENNYSVALAEILIARQLFSIEKLLFSIYFANNSSEVKMIFGEEQFIRIGLTINFLYLTLKLIVNSKKVLEQLIENEVLTNIIDNVVLTQILGVENSSKQTFESKMNNKVISEYIINGENNVLKDSDNCYTRLMITNEGFSIEILQKLFVTLPLLFSTSKESTFKVTNHIHKILLHQNEACDFTYFSLLFPVLCETCCTMHADRNAQLLLINEILELFQTAAKIMNNSFTQSEQNLEKYLSENMELVSVIHVTSFTYLLLLDIHYLTNQNLTKSDNSGGNLQVNACKAGKFLSSFLIWCSKYEENYILFYSAYCITTNINEILEEGLFKSDGWIVDSVKYLFFIMTQYCLSIGKNTESNYLKSSYRREISKNERSELLINFLRESVLSDRQIYCFICASNIINSLSEIHEDLVLSYFQSKVKEFNQILSNIVEEVTEHRKIQCDHFVNFSHIKNIFMFLPYKFLIKMKKDFDLIFKNILSLISNFELENKETPAIVPCVDLEIFLYNSVSTLYFILTIKSIFNYNIVQVESQLDSEDDMEENSTGNTKCFAFKLFNSHVEIIDSYFNKVLEFYKKKEINNSKYSESFSMFIIILEYMASIESKLRFSEKKVHKYFKSFSQNNLTNFYNSLSLNNNPCVNSGNNNKRIPYHDILALIRFGVVNNGLNKHSFKYNDISSSIKSIKGFTQGNNFNL